MSSLPAYLLAPATPVAEPPALEPVLIANDLFFPALDLNEFDRDYLVDRSYSAERRAAVMRQAIIETNQELYNSVCNWTRAGYYSLDAVPQLEHSLFIAVADTETPAPASAQTLVATYKQAVFSRAMALINTRYRNTDTTEHAVPRAENMLISADHYNNEWRNAVLSLNGHAAHSLTGELI